MKKWINNLAKPIALTLVLMLAVTVAYAVPAKPGQKRQLTLADGSTVSAQLVGDEFCHYWLAEDGRAYRDNGNDIYQLIDKQAVSQAAKMRRQKANQQFAKRLPKRVFDGSVRNYTGEKRGLVILVNFLNREFKNANNKALYERIANEKNFSYSNFKGSMYDYFYDQSDGKFELTFDVVGPVELSQEYSYYGKNIRLFNADVDIHPAEMVIEALKLVDDEVDFKKYDWDGDGEVDQVYLIYAGKGEADGGTANTIWPHAYTLTEAQADCNDGDGPQTLDGVTIDTYACGPELSRAGSIDGIGTMCHEFSHCLGYPDFYDIDYSGGQGMGEWDVMCSGCYNGDGFCPAGYTSYERWMAGWREPVELVNTQRIEDMKALTDGGNSYVIYNKGHRDEYYLLENRQQEGWDANLPSSGLLILHVDFDQQVWADNVPNDDPKHQRMTWIPADNEYRYTTTDTYPNGSTNAFGPNTTPQAKLYNKNIDGTKLLDSSVEEIKKSADGTISFLFRGESNVKKPVFSLKAGRYEEPQTVSISCETEGAIIHYTTDGSTPTASSTVYTEPLTISTTTTLKAIAILDEEESEITTAKYTFGASTSDPLTMTFARVHSTNELEPDMRYIIACPSKMKAAGNLNNTYLKSGDVTIDDEDIITINDDITVFVLNEMDNGWSLMDEKSDKYLYATGTKSLAFSDAPAAWTVSNTDNGVILTYDDYGTMLYNVNSPRFTTYTSNPTASMIQAVLYMEHSDGTTPVVSNPLIEADKELTFKTIEGLTQTKTLNVKSQGLKENITITLTDDSKVFSLSSTSIDKSESEATVDVTFAPKAPGTYQGTITLSSAGAESVSVAISAIATEAPIHTEGGNYELVTDESKLKNGDEVIIAYVEGDNAAAISTNQKTNNREASMDVTINADGTLTPGSDVQIITLEKEGELFLFNVGNGYLYAASSNANQMKTTQDPDDNAKASITIDEENNAIIAFQGSSTHNIILYNDYNSSNLLFSCYASNSSQKLPQLYCKVDKTVTGIASVKTIQGQGNVYNLNGQRIGKQTGKGIYIIDGRKVVIR